jgi:hypothetical protein
MTEIPANDVLTVQDGLSNKVENNTSDQNSAKLEESINTIPRINESSSFDASANERIIFYHSKAMITDFETNTIMVLWTEFLCIEVICDIQGFISKSVNLCLDYKLVLACLPKTFQSKDLAGKAIERRQLIVQFILKYLVIQEINGSWGLTLSDEIAVRKDRRRTISSENFETSKLIKEGSESPIKKTSTPVELSTIIKEKPAALQNYSYQDFVTIFCTIALNSIDQETVGIPSLREIMKRQSVVVPGSIDNYDMTNRSIRRHTFDAPASTRGSSRAVDNSKPWMNNLPVDEGVSIPVDYSQQQQQVSQILAAHNPHASQKVSIKLNFASMKQSGNNSNTPVNPSETSDAQSQQSIVSPSSQNSPPASFLPKIDVQANPHPAAMSILSPGRGPTHHSGKATPIRGNSSHDLNALMMMESEGSQKVPRHLVTSPSADDGRKKHIYDFLLANENSDVSDALSTSVLSSVAGGKALPLTVEGPGGGESVAPHTARSVKYQSQQLQDDTKSVNSKSLISLPSIFGGGSNKVSKKNPSPRGTQITSALGINNNADNSLGNISQISAPASSNGPVGYRRKTMGEPIPNDRSPLVPSISSQKQSQQPTSSAAPRRSFEIPGLSSAIQSLTRGVTSKPNNSVMTGPENP